MSAVDEPGVVAAFVDRSRVFINQNDHMWLVIHKTASAGSATDVARFFASDPKKASTHYVVGQDGTIVQCVLEVDGAGGNCCLETGHAAFLPAENLNLRTVSIEHCDPATDNSTPLTSAQKQASFRLIAHICERHNIPKRRATGDGKGGIIGHNDIAPLSRARCPGNYPWDELWAALSGAVPAPASKPLVFSPDDLAVWALLKAGIAHDTGIAQEWLRARWEHGMNIGAPLEAEHQVTRGGESYAEQEFARARASWRHATSECTWYDGRGAFSVPT